MRKRARRENKYLTAYADIRDVKIKTYRLNPKRLDDMLKDNEKKTK